MFGKVIELLSFQGSGNINISNGSMQFSSGVVINQKNGKRQVLVDGVDVSDVVNGMQITVSGDIQSVESVASEIKVEGSVKGTVSTTSGDIVVFNNIEGNVTTTSGDIEVRGNITGDVKTVSGDVEASTITANKITTVSGDVSV